MGCFAAKYFNHKNHLAMETTTTQKRTLLFSALVLFFFSNLFSQPWSYVTGNCCLSGGGSSELLFKSDGTVVSAAFSVSAGIVVREFNGSAWQSLAAPPSTGVVGWFDIEIHNDQLYIAVVNNGMKVYQYNGTAWVQLGSTVPGSFSSTNFDFVVDGAGTPYIACFDRKLYKYDGTAWSNIHTFPQMQGNNPIAYFFISDNTIVPDINNDLLYVINVANRESVYKFDGTTSTMVGDTIIYNQPFYQYTAQLYKNSSNEIFAAFSAFGNTPFIKKFDGTAWQQYGDTTGFKPGAGNSLLAFGNNGKVYFSVSSNMSRVIHATDGASAPFVALDSINRTDFTQVTDLEVNPVTNQPYVAFNYISDTYDVMYYSGVTSGSSYITPNYDIQLMPNPANALLHIATTYTDEVENAMVYDMAGQLLLQMSGRVHEIDVSKLPTGMYVLSVQINSQRVHCKFAVQH